MVTLRRTSLISTKKQITEKIVAGMVAQKAEQHYQEHQTGQIRREMFADVPTMRMQATTGSMTRLPRTTKQMLLMDQQGRPFSMGVNGLLDTVALIEEQIQRFVSIEGRYPAEILLSPLRYLASFSQISHYVLPHFNISIPVRFDRSAYEIYHYEVCVRGE